VPIDCGQLIVTCPRCKASWSWQPQCANHKVSPSGKIKLNHDLACGTVVAVAIVATVGWFIGTVPVLALQVGILLAAVFIVPRTVQTIRDRRRRENRYGHWEPWYVIVRRYDGSGPGQAQVYATCQSKETAKTKLLGFLNEEPLEHPDADLFDPRYRGMYIQASSEAEALLTFEQEQSV
jgi:hypothetical protein